MPKSRIDGINLLLGMGQFSRKSTLRLNYLSDEELFELCVRRPEDRCVWPDYVSEIQHLLSRIDAARKQEPFMSRPQISAELAATICKLSSVKHLFNNGFKNQIARKIRALLLQTIEPAFFELFFEMEQDGPVPASPWTIPTQSAIQLLELYRDELIALPRIKTKQTLDEFDRCDIGIGNFSWMDDAGKSYFEAIEDISFEISYDELPILRPVLDWFAATKPVFDKNQLKLGWQYIERASEAWHQRIGTGEYVEVDISAYPSWHCIVETSVDAWLAVFPKESPYKIVPLTTPQQLLEESKAMRHCVVTYIENCIEGGTRIFSVRDAGSNLRFATAELSCQAGQWKLVQLKGGSNRELMHRLHVAGDPLAIDIEALVNWYNEYSLKQLENQRSEGAKK
jgi:hypothetical protein